MEVLHQREGRCEKESFGKHQRRIRWHRERRLRERDEKRSPGIHCRHAGQCCFREKHKRHIRERQRLQCLSS